MSTRNPLAAWDAAVTAYLTNRRALGRVYEKEEYTLNRVRRFLLSEGARDLDEQLFNRWRAPFYRLSNRTRIIARAHRIQLLPVSPPQRPGLLCAGPEHLRAPEAAAAAPHHRT